MANLESIANSLRGRKEVILASGAYALGSTVDYLSTYVGLVNKEIKELNPIMNKSIETFGLEVGILIPKLIFGAVIIAGACYLNGKKLKRFGKELNLKAEPWLYSGAVAASLVGISWLLEKYFNP